MQPITNSIRRGIELCLAGPQMALGYWNQPELTKEKFTLADLGEEKVRIYHTGDLARYNGEGELEYLGRMDNQVKLRGFRIELGEIESTAAGFEGIALAAAEVKKDQLVLYYSCKGKGQDAPKDFGEPDHKTSYFGENRTAPAPCEVYPNATYHAES